MSETVALWAIAALVLAVCGAVMMPLVAGQLEHERRYGRSRRLRFRSPLRRRVPALPRDGVLTGEEEAAIEAMERMLGKGRGQ